MSPVLRDRAQELATQLAARHTGTQQNMKRLLTEIRGLRDEVALARELQAFGANWSENDAPAALHGFLARHGTESTGERSLQ